MDARRDYTPITELPGSLLTPEQFSRFAHRYALAAGLASGARVLEVACGAGSGLSYLAERASQVVGMDYTEGMLQPARRRLDAALPLVCGDAQQLPFAAQSMDLLLCFEAIYYLADQDAFLAESRRVLAPGGLLVISLTNPDWPDFVPGALSTYYPSGPELHHRLFRAGFAQVQLYGALPVSAAGGQQRLLHKLRRILDRTGLLPRLRPLAAQLMRLGYGELIPLPVALDSVTVAAGVAGLPLTPLAPDAPDRVHRVLYALACV
jgi:ubiquinone/menaquinone biosynthesis C-methylase UbiE